MWNLPFSFSGDKDIDRVASKICHSLIFVMVTAYYSVWMSILMLILEPVQHVCEAFKVSLNTLSLLLSLGLSSRFLPGPQGAVHQGRHLHSFQEVGYW